MKKLLSIVVIVLIIFSMVFVTPLATAVGARIWTDKEDYALGETVSIFGSDFNALAEVTITIKRPNSIIDTVYAVTNGVGSFSCTYQLDGIAGTYTVTATDGTNTATTTFTDRKWYVSVSPTSATVPQGGSTTATVTVTADPTGGPEVDLWATGQPTGVTVSFSPTKGTPYFTSTMSINVGPTTTPGTYPIDIIVCTGQPGQPSYSEKARTTFTLTITGIPPATVTITITSSPVTGAGFVKVDDIPITTPTTFTWTIGSTHKLEALSPVAGSLDTQYVWTSWSDGGAQTHTYTVPSSSETVTANYKTQYQITVAASPSGALGGTFKVTYTQCGTTYTNVQKTTTWIEWADANTMVSVSEPQDVINGASGTRYKFDHYNPSSGVTMDQAKTITLVYKTQYQITVRTNSLGAKQTNVYNGTNILGIATDAAPYADWFDQNSVIQLDIDTPISGSPIRYVFTQWTGGASGSTRPCPVTMSSLKDITANYKTQYQITVTASLAEALGGTFKVTYTQCGTTYTNVQKTTTWTEWADAGTSVSVSEPQDIVNGYKFDHYDPSQSVTMSAAKTITLFYIQISGLSVSISPTTGKIKVGESVAFTSTMSGGLSPYSYQWYLNGAAVPGATSPTWTFTPTTTGTYTVYLNITDSVPKTAKSNEASVTVAPPLTVLVSPTSASILVGQSVTFTSTVSGGYTPYTYQWYLNDAPVSGATSGSWTFTPTTSGIYYVYLKVTDANNNVVQSETARISVASVPVGGYSISLAKQTSTSHMAAYTMVIAVFAAAMSLTKRKRK